MKKIEKSHLLLVALFLAILPYCYLSFFANPSSDDFGFAAQAKNNDLLFLIKQTYLYWNGRYVSNIFIYLNPISFDNFIGYKVVPFLMIVLFCLANFSCASQFFFGKSKRTQLVISLALSLLFLHNMPIISEGIYWYTGSVIYVLGIIVLLFYVALLIKVIRENKKGVYSILSVFLLLLACGFNEVLTLLIVFFLAVLLFIFYKNRFEGKKIILIQFLFSTLFVALVVFSPGNAIRGEAYQNAHNFFHSFIYSALQVGRFSFLWMASIPLFAASFIYFQVNKKVREENQLFKNSFYLNRWGSLLILFGVIFICVFPAYWATGILGQHRTLNVAYFFFLVMWFINLTVWYNHYQHKMRFEFTSSIKTILNILLLVGIVATGNGYNSLKDIFSGSAKKYDIQLKTRFEILDKAKELEEKQVIISQLNAQPKCLFVSDITNNPQDWTRKAYNLYFRIDSTIIVLK